MGPRPILLVRHAGALFLVSWSDLRSFACLLACFLTSSVAVILSHSILADLDLSAISYLRQEERVSNNLKRYIFLLSCLCRAEPCTSPLLLLPPPRHAMRWTGSSFRASSGSYCCRVLLNRRRFMPAITKRSRRYHGDTRWKGRRRIAM